MLGCNANHHKIVLFLREMRDHPAFTVFFIIAILYSGLIVSNCRWQQLSLRHAVNFT
jgi:hypothetical protein